MSSSNVSQLSLLSCGKKHRNMSLIEKLLTIFQNSSCHCQKVFQLDPFFLHDEGLN